MYILKHAGNNTQLSSSTVIGLPSSSSASSTPSVVRARFLRVGLLVLVLRPPVPEDAAAEAAHGQHVDDGHDGQDHEDDERRLAEADEELEVLLEAGVGRLVVEAAAIVVTASRAVGWGPVARVGGVVTEI